MSNSQEHGEGPSLLERALGVVTEVRPGEGVTALLLALNVFLLLTAYYVIKPVREALILVMEDGAKYKSYMGGAIAIALLFAVPAYSRFASRVPRNRLVVSVTLFFLSHLILFYFGSAVGPLRPYLGLVFYLWVGIFNMMVVAQFWAFANDLYDDEQGKRLFALIGLGASLGAALGTQIAAVLIEPIGLYQLLLIAAALLGVCAFVTQIVHTRELRRSASDEAEGPPDPPASGAGAFRLVREHRYLTLLAVFSLVFTCVNTNGEYMLGVLFAEDAVTQAKEKVGPAEAETWLSSTAGAHDLVRREFERDRDEFTGRSLTEVEAEISLRLARKEATGRLIGIGYSRFFLWVNVGGVVIQTLFVSRLVKHLGLRIAFFILPFIAFTDALVFLLFPVLGVLRIGKTAENATDYSLNNTLRNMLWLPTTKEMKYKAKQAVDTFFVRMGDVSSALLVAVGSGMLGWSVRAFATANLFLVVLWLVIALAIVRSHAAMQSPEGA